MIVCGPVAGSNACPAALSNEIVAPSQASTIACRNVPAPLSAVPVTVMEDEHTDSDAVLLVSPVPPFVELTAPVVFETLPTCVGVTFTTTVQVLPGVVMLPPDRLMLVLFAVAVRVPPQVLLMLGVLATCNPLVNVSLKAMPFSEVVLAEGLVIVKVKVVVPLS